MARGYRLGVTAEGDAIDADCKGPAPKIRVMGADGQWRELEAEPMETGINVPAWRQRRVRHPLSRRSRD